MSERIQKVVVRIEVETNKGSYADTLEQADDESGEEFRARVDAVLYVRMKVS